MTFPKQAWARSEPDHKIVEELSHSLKNSYGIELSRIGCELLVNRKIIDPQVVYEFLYPDLNHLHDPFSMADMDKAIEIIIDAIVARKKIWIYGDYDVDGITSVSLLLLFLQSIGHNADFYIPDRIKEGYGLNRDAIGSINGKGGELLITVDCGISSRDEIAFARSLGMTVIVSDHHEVPDTLPDAHAILNPRRRDCAFPFKELAGVGIAYNLLIALRGELRRRGLFPDLPNLKRFLDLVALGTVADVVPLVDENRLFVRYGLAELNESARPGIIALKETSGTKTVGTSEVSFRLAPRLNASGRIGSATMGVRLLVTDDPAEAMDIARGLDSENRKRQSMEEDVLINAINIINNDRDFANRRSVVLASEGWHPGVVGIVASRLVERFYRPVIMLSLKDGMGRGSARSITGFHLYEGLTQIGGLLSSFGGHKYAAGLSIAVERIPEFASEFERIVVSMTTESDFVPTLRVDAEIALADIKRHNLLHEAKLLFPFGAGNPEPLFSAKGLVVREKRIVGNNHLRLVFRDKNDRWDAIAFGFGDFLKSEADLVDVVFHLRENQWDRGSSCELNIRGIRQVN